MAKASTGDMSSAPGQGTRSHMPQVKKIPSASTKAWHSQINTVARIWKHLRCPSADEWIRKLWYMYTMEYYSAVKRNMYKSVLMR